ncbi:hypothetical protein [Mycolicibacterium sphagni]|uniref:Uncharacterized protein n=1 Tax=Mycolicibacterium sphagni TaxID=1786 RepID=A0ABX2JY75_9MYCO|nr:hypothetical protein [Mycolicibacterium sphagni]NTY62621.1 hypothetical protein [Mycolicibacterium sphagni]
MCFLDPDIDYAHPHGARGYGQTLSTLADLLDVDWRVTDSGGGCQLIVSGELLEGGYRIQVSDRDGPLSPYPQRARACHGGHSVGWAVGIYSAATDYTELHGWADTTDNHADVAALTAAALNDYRRHRGAICHCPTTGRN